MTDSPSLRDRRTVWGRPAGWELMRIGAPQFLFVLATTVLAIALVALVAILSS